DTLRPTKPASREPARHGSRRHRRRHPAPPPRRPRPVAPQPARAVVILVVDDHADAAASLARLLEIRGHDVQIACDGSEAIAVALRWRPQFVPLDVGLPVVDGYQVATYLQREVLGKETVIIAVTGYGQSEDRDRSGRP